MKNLLAFREVDATGDGVADHLEVQLLNFYMFNLKRSKRLPKSAINWDETALPLLKPYIGNPTEPHILARWAPKATLIARAKKERRKQKVEQKDKGGLVNLKSAKEGLTKPYDPASSRSSLAVAQFHSTHHIGCISATILSLTILLFFLYVEANVSACQSQQVTIPDQAAQLVVSNEPLQQGQRLTTIPTLLPLVASAIKPTQQNFCCAYSEPLWLRSYPVKASVDKADKPWTHTAEAQVEVDDNLAKEIVTKHVKTWARHSTSEAFHSILYWFLASGAE
eukprot:g17073.t1